jgi:hypothetical protein
MPNRKISLLSSILALSITLCGALPAAAATFATSQNPQRTSPDDGTSYWEAIQRASSMVGDAEAQRLAAMYGLQILNVTWEDTGRYYNSAVGPNISDMTIQVGYEHPESRQFELALMPVIRYPNFADRSADISPDRFYLLVGNEKDGTLRRVSLTEYLGHFREYLSDPESWAGEERSLLAERDTHVLVSAQAAFLPIPQGGRAEFNPVIFNYQSYAGDPAVLAIVATREGTSATIIDNVRDAFPSGFSWGQRLFFNQNGERASFTGERLSDFQAENGTASGAVPEAAGRSGLNMVLLIQVPLKQQHPMMSEMLVDEAEAVGEAAPAARSDVEAAVIGHGDAEGPFTEIDGLKIERDERFPIRVTVQFYKATSNGIVSAGDMEEIATQIQRVYEEADYVGSLVVDGPSDRPTEHAGPKDQPPGWWDAFWNRFEGNTGLGREDAYALLHELGAYAGRCVDVLRMGAE